MLNDVKNTTLYVGSLKYSPVYKLHCCAFGKVCEELGYSVKYLFSRGYEWLLPEEIKEKTIFVGSSVGFPSMLRDVLSLKNRKLLREAFLEDKPMHIYLHNYHYLNHYIADLAEKAGTILIYHVHEPYVEDKKAHGGLQQYWIHLFEHFQGELLKKTNIAVVSSKEASSLFNRRYHNFRGKKVFIPLMYEDLGNGIDTVRNKRYVTFVGPPVPAKGPEKFLEIVEYSAMKELPLDFLLISHSKITHSKYYNKHNLKVFYKEKIGDQEFGDLIRQSFVVVTPYERETQSSVILVSYMYGTPVVSSNVGALPEFVFHRKTGYLLDTDAKVEEWIEGISFVRKYFTQLSKNCRKYFVKNFSGENWKKYLDVLIG